MSIRSSSFLFFVIPKYNTASHTLLVSDSVTYGLGCKVFIVLYLTPTLHQYSTCTRTGSPKQVTVPSYQRADIVKARWIRRRSGRARDTHPFASRSFYCRSELRSVRTQDTEACDKFANPRLAQRKGEPGSPGWLPERPWWPFVRNQRGTSGVRTRTVVACFTPLHDWTPAVRQKFPLRRSLIVLLRAQHTKHGGDALLAGLGAFGVFDGAHMLFLVSIGEPGPGLFGFGVAGDDLF